MMRDQNSGKPWIGASQKRADCSWLSLFLKAIESKWFIRKKAEITKSIKSFRSTAESSLRLARFVEHLKIFFDTSGDLVLNDGRI